MTNETRGVRAVRVLWAVLGGVWGAWLGFGGYFRLPHNADTFGTMIAAGFFGLFAFIGLFLGLAAGALIGGSVEKALRRSGAGSVAALGVATLMNAVVLWQIGRLVQAQFPGLRS